MIKLMSVLNKFISVLTEKSYKLEIQQPQINSFNKTNKIERKPAISEQNKITIEKILINFIISNPKLSIQIFNTPF